MIFCTLNKYLKESKITQTKLAEMTGVTRPTLNQLIKNENHSIRYDLIEDLCEIFDLHLNDLLKQTERKLTYLYSNVEYDIGVDIQTEMEHIIADISVLFTYGENIKLEFNGNLFYSLINEDITGKIKPVILKCFLNTNDYEIVLNELIKTEILEDFIDTFNIKEQIVDEHNFSEDVIGRFVFDVLPYTKEQRLIEYFKTLTDEEIETLYKRALEDLENNIEDDE